MQVSDSDTSESSDSGQSPRKRRKEKRDHTHKRSPHKSSRTQKERKHKEKKHKRHKERHRIDKELSPRSVMADAKSGTFCPQKSRIFQESEAAAERRLAAAKHCAEQRETAFVYQAVVTAALPVQSCRECAASLISRPYPCADELTTDPWTRAGDARGVPVPPCCRVTLHRRRCQHHLRLRAITHHGSTIAHGSQIAYWAFATAGLLRVAALAPRLPTPVRSVHVYALDTRLHITGWPLSRRAGCRACHRCCRGSTCLHPLRCCISWARPMQVGARAGSCARFCDDNGFLLCPAFFTRGLAMLPERICVACSRRVRLVL